MGAEAATLPLPGRLDGATAPDLHATLVSLRGQDLVLDAEAVERVGGLGLQLLIATQRTWSADGKRLAIANPSDALREAFGVMGVDPDFLGADPS